MSASDRTRARALADSRPRAQDSQPAAADTQPPAQPPTADTRTPAASDNGPAGRSYGSGARILSIGIAATGLFTFAYFSIASHVLNEVDAKRLDLLWSVMFVVISVIYRPIEQLLSRTIAERRAQGHAEHPLRTPIAIQAGFALVFLLVALALHGELVNHVFNGYSALYDVLVFGTLAYAGSYFARGWLAGHEYFALYGGLVLMESTSRICFALAVAIGIASGQTAVALGIAAAPLLSLVVVPAAFARRGHERGVGRDSVGGADEPAVADAQPRAAADGPPAAELAPLTVDEAAAALAGPGTEGVQEASHTELSLRRGGRFALWVSGIMLSEQMLLNAAVLTVDATSSNRALAGIVFNVMLIARAPLQLFQAIQTSLLPHLTGLEAKEGHAAFARAIRADRARDRRLRRRHRARAAADRPVRHGPRPVRPALHLRTLRPRADRARHGHAPHLRRAQPGGARPQPCARRRRLLARRRSRVHPLDVLPAVGNQVLRAELGYFGATSLLALLLALLYRRGTSAGAPGRAIA